MIAESQGQLRKHEKYRSRFLPRTRDLIVYLPPGYDENSRLHYPVLYLQDGQNLFDGATSFIPGMDWRVKDTADQLIAHGAIRPLIIVGIYNAGRWRLGEYTPSRDKKMGGGKADRYVQMLLEEIRPFIESQYRTLDGPANTGIGGSSLGGLLTLGIGPAIRADSYEVGDAEAAEVTAAFGADAAALLKPTRPGHCTLDLVGGLRLQLRRAGVKDANVHDMGIDTRTNADEFFSHRAARPSGRFAAVALLPS